MTMFARQEFNENQQGLFFAEILLKEITNLTKQLKEKNEVIENQQKTIEVQKELIQTLEVEKEQLQVELVTDPLTKAFNRRKLDEKKEGYTIIADCNSFKAVNDTYGHDIGDLVLIETVNQFKKHLRGEDIIRMGGDEFVIVLENANSEEDATAIVDRLKTDIPFVEVLNRDNELIRVSLSIGFAENFKAADDAMYKAKREYKNIRENLLAISQNNVYDRIRTQAAI